MFVVSRLSSCQLPSVPAKTLKSSYRKIIGLFMLCAVFASPGLMQTQTAAAGPAQTTDRIIVKIKPSLARETEAQMTGATPSVQVAHIHAGQSGNARIEGFLRRHSAQQLSPLYPQMIRLKKQHGWSDAQVAEHIRQRFANRSNRVVNPVAVPEISRTYILEFAQMSDQVKARTLQRLKADPEVEFVEPERTFTISQIPNDPFLSSSGTWGQPYGDLWGLPAINAPAAWDTAQGDGVVVAVIDTGVDYNHPDLAGNIWTNPNEVPGNFLDDDGNGFTDDFHGWNFVNNTNDPIDDNGHGTHVAGTIAAEGNNGIGVIGVAWHAKIMPLKGFDSSGTGFDFTVAPAIMYAANNGADVINASWDSFNSNIQVFGNSQTIEEAIQYAASLGVVFVASAGNSSQDASNFFPANSPEAITVASSGPFGNFSFFSNFGPRIDVTAPGEDILSLQAANTFQGFPVTDGYVRMTGTSMAAAHVSGVAALILSGNPSYTAEQVKQIIRVSSTSVPFDPRFSSGMLNAAAAVTTPAPLDTKITGVQFGASPIDPITILGSAQGNGFASYLLEYGAGTQPFFFTPFFSSVTPASGTLGQLDPSNLSDGVYTIRLTAFNTNGNAFIDTTQFTLVLCTITNPVPGAPPASSTAYKAGVLLPITGTAIIGGFQNFVVEWSPNGTDQWQTGGITLVGSGTTPIVNGQIATWDTAAAAQAGFTQPGFYQIRLTVNGNISEQMFTQIYLEPDLISPAFPALFDLSPYFVNSGVVPASNADGSLRLIMASPNQGVDPAASWVFNLDGSFQKTTLSSFGSNHQPAAGNLDGLPGDEAVVSDTNVIRVIHPDNSFELFTPGVNVDLSNVPLLLDDLNNDFQLESITVGSDFNNNTAYVFAWKPDGQQAAGFPIQVQDNHGLLKGSFNHTRVIAGDFDGDGLKDILVQEGLTSTSYTLRLFNHDGTPKPFNAPELTGVPFAMAAADLDHNGKLETILANYNGFLPTQATLHVFQPDGSERPGWPVDVSASNGNGSSLASIAVGDFRRDGHEEIVLARDPSIYLFNSDGTLFSAAWPLPPHFPGYGPAVIGDVDGDGFPEIITTLNDSSATNGFRLLAIHSDGTLAKSWLLPGSNGLGFGGGFPAPVLGDFNQDGTTDIAITYPLVANSGSNPGLLTILDTHVPFNTAQMDWPINFQNPRNNPVLLRTSAGTLNVTLAAGSNPSAPGDTLVFTASLTPNTSSGAIQFLDGGTPISGSVPLSSGTASFTTSNLALGAHSITARYTGANKVAASTSPILLQTVARPSASISVNLTAGTNPSASGTALTFTANVAPISATGTVIFFDGGTAISGSTPLSNGVASFTTAGLAAGSHSISAQYSGDANFNGATSAALVQSVLKAQTTLVLMAPDDSVKLGAPATFTATISPISAPGAIVFFDGATQISGSVAVNNGTAKFTTTSLVSGTHTLSARYSGGANFNGSSSNSVKVKVK
jgi:Subtilase family/Bacterial Ig-like domain (group 3)/FG-GAP-like repeat